MTGGVAEPQGRPSFILGEGGLCDPLKGWDRNDTALPDTFSIERPGIDVTGFCPQLI